MAVPSVNQVWLDLTVEEALEPDLPICDPHHHLWDKRTDRLAPRYLLDELLEDTNGGFRRYVFTLTSHSEDTFYLPLPTGEYTVEVQNRLVKNKTYINSLISRQTKLLKIEQGKDIPWDIDLKNIKQ